MFATTVVYFRPRCIQVHSVVNISRSTGLISQTPGRTVFTARSSYASAVSGIDNPLYPSIRLSVTRVLRDETAEILIPHERVINLVF